MLERNPQLGVSYARLSFSIWRKKLRNTFLQPKWVWKAVIGESIYRDIMDPDPVRGQSLRTKIQKFLQRPILTQTFLWFWPIVTVEESWARGEVGHSRDPSPYRKTDQHGLALCETIIRHAPNKNLPMLELGCSAGRYLDRLVQEGYTDLHGIDISSRALELMGEWFPKSAKKVTLKHDMFQRYLPQIPERHFNVVFTHGGTIETVHPSFNIVKEIARVTNRHAILYIREHEFRTRFWEYEFRRQGFVTSYVVKPLETIEAARDQSVAVTHTTLFVFTRSEIGIN